MTNPFLREFSYELPDRGSSLVMARRRRPRRGRMREDALDAPDGTDPLVLEDEEGTKCEPCLTINKDAAKFAACNAIADKIGPINTPKKAFRLLQDAIGDEVNEVFGVLMLDLHMRHKGIGLTGRGEPASVMAPVNPTLQMVLMNGATAAIIFHVHPSGIEAQPSDADIETTEEFVAKFDNAEVPLLDHIIVGGDAKRRSYYSFAEDKAL